jgi:hypothetical protein
MSAVARQIKIALDEARILVLGAQVLVGLEFRTIFEKRFPELARGDQFLKLAGLWLLLLALAVVMSPAARHRLVERGRATVDFHRFVTRACCAALLPFALALGLDGYVAGRAMLSARASAWVGACVVLLAMSFWYALGWLRVRRHPRGEEVAMRESESSSSASSSSSALSSSSGDAHRELEERINHALTEVRVVLPGAQALLGFQAAILFTEAFERVAPGTKYAHLASLMLIMVAVILLMTPAAYHRLAERGGYSEHLHRFVSRMLIAAMAVLGLGIATDFYVAAEKVTGSAGWSAGLAGVTLGMFYGLWFGYTLWVRAARRVGEKPVVEGTGGTVPLRG